MITVVGGLKVERLSLVLDLIEDHQYSALDASFIGTAWNKFLQRLLM